MLAARRLARVVSAARPSRDDVRVAPSPTARDGAQIVDDRDPDVGSRLLKRMKSTSPYKKDGMHYFSAITWCNPGEYRVTFFLLNPHPSRSAAARRALVDEPLARTIIVTDPEFEARHAVDCLEVTAEEMETAAAAAERSAAYATAAPTKRER